MVGKIRSDRVCLYCLNFFFIFAIDIESYRRLATDLGREWSGVSVEELRNIFSTASFPRDVICYYCYYPATHWLRKIDPSSREGYGNWICANCASVWEKYIVNSKQLHRHVNYGKRGFSDRQRRDRD